MELLGASKIFSLCMLLIEETFHAIIGSASMRPFCKCTPCVILTVVPCPAGRSPITADLPDSAGRGQGWSLLPRELASSLLAPGSSPGAVRLQPACSQQPEISG